LVALNLIFLCNIKVSLKYKSYLKITCIHFKVTYASEKKIKTKDKSTISRTKRQLTYENICPLHNSRNNCIIEFNKINRIIINGLHGISDEKWCLQIKLNA